MDEINDVKAPVETNEESPMIKWAKREVEIVLQQLTQRQPITDYDRECYTAALEAFEFLCKQGHSGYSFAETFKILTRLCNRQPLCYINEGDFEPEGLGIDNCNREINGPLIGKTSYQCLRMPSLFKHVWEDGKVTYRDHDRILCIDSENINNTFYWGFAAQFVNQMFPITLPYMPMPGKHYRIYVTSFTTNSMDVCAINQIVEPSGNIVKVDRYFKFTDDEEWNGRPVEITQDKYEELKANRDVSIETKYARYIIDDLIDYQDKLKTNRSLLRHKEMWNDANNEAYSKYKLLGIWHALMRRFRDSTEIDEIFNTIKSECSVFVGCPIAGWDVVRTLCSSVRKDVDDFVDKHPEFRGLAETIQKAQEEIGRLIMNYVEQMKEIENKIIAISGETPEQMEELRINAIREIANQLESAGERHRC